MKSFTGVALIVIFHFILFTIHNVNAQSNNKVPKPVIRPLLQADIDALLIAHNNIRRNANPTPKPPLTLAVWDPKAAKKADAQVVKCDPTGLAGTSGVNFMYTQSSSYISRDNFPQRVVAQWDSESKFYNYQKNRCNNSTCNGYLQLVVSATKFSLGCARSITCPSDDDVKPHTEYVVCFYSQAPTKGKTPYHS